MAIYLCHEGHKHRTQDGATNCGYCKAIQRKQVEKGKNEKTINDLCTELFSIDNEIETLQSEDKIKYRVNIKALQRRKSAINQQLKLKRE